jgi:hypothetical protein
MKKRGGAKMTNVNERLCEIEKEIEREKKKLWKNYTPVINQNFEAFELMRKIGVLQGKAQLLRKKQ